MAAERRNGAGSRLASVLEQRPTPPSSAPEIEEVDRIDGAALEVGPAESEPVAASRGAGGSGPKSSRGKTAEARASKKIKGHTLYLHDDLFERLLVQAHRRGKTISEYVAAILERQVPDHNSRGARGARPESGESEAA